MAEAAEKLENGAEAARYYKYLAQANNPSIVRKLPLERVQSKCFYMKHQKAFDLFTAVCQKYGIDEAKYFKFLVYQCGKGEKDVPEVLQSKAMLSKFVDFLRVQQQYSKIYSWFLKSAEYVSSQCAKLGMSSAEEYLQHLIATRQLAAMHLAGKLSVYYLSAIQNFKEIYSKLDPLSQSELSTILSRYDKYNSDVNEAFKMRTSCKLSPLKFTDELLQKANNTTK